MGQKVNPVGMRIGVIRDWESRWYAEKEYGTLLQEDIKVRQLVEKESKDQLVSHIEIERSKNHINLIIRTARPGSFIGGTDPIADKLKVKLAKLTGKEIDIKIIEVANPDVDARLVALKIAKMIEERQSFRTAQKKAIQQTMRSGAKGIKTAVSGRLGGADIARSEGYSEGVVPLHTLRSDIDFAWEEAMTAYGKLGVKVWICRGEVMPGEMVQEPEKPKGIQDRPRKGNRRFNKADAKAEANVEETANDEVKEEAIKEDAE